MALFQRFFYRKPLDRLLEISDRVYVFDCCFSTEVFEEDEYKVYVGGIVAELQDCYPDSSFMVLNFREGDKRTQIADVLSQYDMTVMEYPGQYEGCPMLPLEMIHYILRSSENWLSLAGQQTVLLMHCERGGWPVLAFMLAALLLFRKQYNGERKTLEMVYKQAPRDLLHLFTHLNPQPSQVRYLQYISRSNLGSDWPPTDTPLTMDCIIVRFLPLFDEKGCRPVVRIYGQDSSLTTANRSSKLLFTSSKKEKQARYYQPEECELVKIDIHHRVQGDLVLECIHLDHVREKMLFRAMFHTTFVRNSVLVWSRDEVDVMWDARDHMPKNFKAEVLFSDTDALQPTITTTEEFEEEFDDSNTYEEFYEIEEIFSNAVDGQDAKGEQEAEPEVEAFDDSASDNGNIKPETKVSGALQGSWWEEIESLSRGEPQSALGFDESDFKSQFSGTVPKKDTFNGGGSRKFTGSKTGKVHLIYPRRANNMEIMLKKVKMPLPDLMATALSMDESILDTDQVQNLIGLCPTTEEMELLKNYTGDKEMLDKCEQSILELMKVPRIKSKLRVFLFKIQFNFQLTEFKKSLNTINAACDEVRTSVKLKEIMKRIIYLGNKLHQGTVRGSAVGFKLDSLLKLTDTRASNSKMTLMHYLCKVLASKSPALLDFHLDLVSLESATKIQIMYLAVERKAIIEGLEKGKQELDASANDGPVSEVFHKTLNEFIGFAESEVASVTNLYSVVDRNADSLALYFGEDPAPLSFDQVTRILLNFVRLFRKAHEENSKQAELEKKESLKRSRGLRPKT